MKNILFVSLFLTLDYCSPVHGLRDKSDILRDSFDMEEFDREMNSMLSDETRAVLDRTKEYESPNGVSMEEFKLHVADISSFKKKHQGDESSSSTFDSEKEFVDSFEREREGFLENL